jgi:hypothetical protein
MHAAPGKRGAAVIFKEDGKPIILEDGCPFFKKANGKKRKKERKQNTFLSLVSAYSAPPSVSKVADLGPRASLPTNIQIPLKM